MLRDMLRLENIEVGRKHVSTLMKKMGIEALYRKANTSRRNQAHRIYPDLLRHPIRLTSTSASRRSPRRLKTR